MEQYIQLVKMGCFNREDVAKITGNIRTADSVLYSHKKKGLIVSVRRNLYAAISLETNQPLCTPYQIASNISADSYISHHSAFEYHGMANQVFSELYVSSSSKFNDFEFDGKHYTRIQSKTIEGVKTIGKVRVTDIERTIVDSVKDFTKIGGLEELLRSLAMITYATEEKLIKYLSIYNNQFLWQKVGYFLSCFPNMKLSPRFFEICKGNSKKSVRYLYEELKFENPVFSNEWGLYVPNDILKLLGEGGESLV
jgi:predicted transcriptional regulator of viral defense system